MAGAGLEVRLPGALGVILRCGRRCCRGSGRRGQADFRDPHPAGLVYGVNAAPPACGQLFEREAQASVRGALHPAERPVSRGGMGDAVVQGVGGPAGEIIRQRVALAPLLEVIAAAILAAGQVAADAVGQVGGRISGLAPQGDGPA